MIITVKVKYGTTKQEIESFGNNRYLVYLLSKEDENPNEELFALLSRKMGVPQNRIVMKQDGVHSKIIDVL